MYFTNYYFNVSQNIMYSLVLATMTRDNFKTKMVAKGNKDKNVFVTVFIGFLNIKQMKSDEKWENLYFRYI